ncbi:MAG: hypothetical protein JWL80_414 [Parcubacteria group bacterium]|nr:hypothetical protein [Parcubacteria group bacterium]
MITIEKIELRCPVCEKEFQSEKIVDKIPVYRLKTDLHPQILGGPSPFQFMIHTCPECGYTKTADGFKQEPQTYANIALVMFLESEVTPRFRWLNNSITASEKYEAYAKIREFEGAGPRIIADHFLAAAWCCVEEGDTEGERYFRRLAAQKYHDALASFDEMEIAETFAITYLVGELWRRVGDNNKALVWFNKVLAFESRLGEDCQWIIDACRKQMTNPTEWL